MLVKCSAQHAILHASTAQKCYIHAALLLCELLDHASSYVDCHNGALVIQAKATLRQRGFWRQ